MSETEFLPEGATLAGPGMYDAGHGVSYTPYYDEHGLVGLYMWHPCPLTRERLGVTDGAGVGPNAKTGKAWGYENTEDPARITLIGSVLDPECGWHGFIRDGRWEPC
ncbi:hypothetical protein SEA_CONFIDENCE_31 [Gordonia phage Confidence]|nr:hypothetical protein SEA_CONFIDENCE_31 [Gordonia phage Confidence]